LEIFRHIEELSGQFDNCVVALGNFDGFHRGHQAVIGEAGRFAREKSVPLAIFTTEPHPRSFFAPGADNFRLTPFRARARLLEAFGVDVLFVPQFDAELAATSAEDFVGRILVGALGAGRVVVGYDYRFGKGRRGDVGLLKDLRAKHDYELTIIDPVAFGIEGVAGEVYSSSLVREALLRGEARRAAALLGHWWSIDGRIVRGDERGRTIGFATANIELHETIIPRHGVYAVRLSLEGFEDTILDGVANIGKRPTFDKQDELLEVHLFDFDRDIYDVHASVELVGFIRGEEKFDGIEALKAQIKADCTTARQILDDPDNERAHLSLPDLDSYLKRYPDA
jgi:riboflavin kinase / FMN adenylyltransferase